MAPTRSRLGTWFLIIRCLVLWPIGFASMFTATFAAVAIWYNDPGGPLFWPLAWIASATVYALVLGVPLALCSGRRRWWLRLIPAVIAAAPVAWALAEAGLWAVPPAAFVAVSIAVEAFVIPAATGATARLAVRSP